MTRATPREAWRAMRGLRGPRPVLCRPTAKPTPVMSPGGAFDRRTPVRWARSRWAGTPGQPPGNPGTPGRRAVNDQSTSECERPQQQLALISVSASLTRAPGTRAHHGTVPGNRAQNRGPVPVGALRVLAGVAPR